MSRKSKIKEIAEKIAEILDEEGEKTAEELDIIVKESVETANKLGRKFSCASLNDLFDQQVETLRKNGLPDYVISEFRYLRKDTVETASRMRFQEGSLPFVPVVPRSYFGIYGLARFMRGDAAIEKIGIETKMFKDLDDSGNNHLYYIFDIASSDETLHLAPQQGREIIKKQGRFGLSLAEAYGYATHSNIISKQGIYAIESLCGVDISLYEEGKQADESALYCVPCICRNYFPDHKIEIISQAIFESTHGRGTPSCGKKSFII